MNFNPTLKWYFVCIINWSNINVNARLGVQVAGGQPGQAPVLIDTIRRQEVDLVLNNQNIILSTAREIKSFVGDVHSKTESILNNQARAPTAQVHIIYMYILWR